MSLKWDGMFNDIIEWFLGRAGDRRQYQRRAGAFRLQYTKDAANFAAIPKDAIGLEVSPNGLMFIIQAPIAEPEYNLQLRLNDSVVPVRVKTVRSDTVPYQGQQWHRYMGEFVGIAADHWDMIVRYVNHQPELDRRKMQNQEMSDRVDDAYRLLPLAMQRRIIDVLVSKGRLEAPQDGKEPLLKLFYGGRVNRAGTKPAHRFNVHSRIAGKEGMVAFDTRFLVTDDGEVHVM